MYLYFAFISNSKTETIDLACICTCFVYLKRNRNRHFSIVIILWVYQTLNIIYPLTLSYVCGERYFYKSFVRKLKQIYKAEGSLFVVKNENQIWNNANEFEWICLHQRYINRIKRQIWHGNMLSLCVCVFF